MSLIRKVEIDGKTVQFEFNKFAKQANGSVMVSCGGTQVLVAVCAAPEPTPGLDFFPLGVEYIEKAYAVGRVPGGYAKREGKPTDAATLMARVIDRPLRPCFPSTYRNETVVTVTVVSYEVGYSAVTLGLLGASTALMISEIPFNGPVAGLRVGYEDGKYVVDPLEGEEGELDLNIACKRDAVLMVEAGCNFLSEDQVLDAIDFAQETMRPFFDMQEEIQREIGKPKWAVPPQLLAPTVVEQVRTLGHTQLAEAFTIQDKLRRYATLKALGRSLVSQIATEDTSLVPQVKEAFEDAKSDYMRQMILTERKRIDGRALDQVRPISCEVGTLIRPHGSALFTRGETQSLAAVTLASSEDQQRTDNLWGGDQKTRFMLHYNFPPYCVGEARMQRSPGRREIGHGNLAQKALSRVIPPLREFGYTIRIVSEVLESNGSSSMASVCSGTLGMLAAGIPILKPVAGIAMGLIKEDDRYAVLSDISGDEDHLGDMDFKVCGTRDGITALQMDIKIGGISRQIMAEALAQAKAGRLHILDKMETAISEPAKVSLLAPRIFKLKIKKDKIRDLIGPGGKTIKRITAETGIKIDIDDSGIISLVAPDEVSAEAAKALIRACISDPQVGEVYLGRVVKVIDFGVFIEIKPGVDGLCHITHLDEKRVEHVEDVAKVGDELLVKIVEIDKQGRIKLSRREALGQKPTVFA